MIGSKALKQLNFTGDGFMKKIIFLEAAIIAAAACFSCQTLKNADISSLASNIQSSNTTSTIGSGLGSIDFKSGEVLCSWGDDSMKDSEYYVAKVITPDSPATKNQAEVLFLDGKQKWINYVIPSHKATKAELTIGANAFHAGVSEWEECNQDQYRKAGWWLGKVTAVDEMFKGIVEISGRKCHWERVRIPEAIIK